MSATPVVEALRLAQNERASGCLTLSAGSKRTVLWLRAGDVVGAHVGFGYQSLLQARLLGDQLTLAELDALWARGGVPEEDEPLSEQRQRLDESLRWLLTLRRAVALAEDATLEVNQTELPTPPPHDGPFAPLPVQALVSDEPLSVWVPEVANGPPGTTEWNVRFSEAATDGAPESWVASLPNRLDVSAEPDLDLDVNASVSEVRASRPGPEAEQWTTRERPGIAMTLDDHWASAFSGPEAGQDAESAQSAAHPGAAVGAPPNDAIAGQSDKAVAEEQTPSFADGAETSLSEEDELANEHSDDPAVAAKARRQRLLRRAMENMGVIAQRPIEGAVPLSESSSASAPATTNAPAVDSEIEKLGALIRRRHDETLSKKDDPFGVLGLPRSATKEQVKAAYLELAKSYHPDRLPGALGSLSSQMTIIFEAIRSAYEILYDDSKRAAYLVKTGPEGAAAGLAAASAKSKTPEEQAQEAFRLGEVQLKKRDFRAAEESFLEAHASSAKGEYLAAAGWALYLDTSRRDEQSRATKLMADALKADPSCARAHYQLGVVARVEGDMTKAERHFREAVQLSPKHAEANQELRLIEMRKRGKRGLFR